MVSKKYSENENLKDMRNSLRGKWFHTVKTDGGVDNQGQILEVYEGALLCQLYSYMDGRKSNVTLYGLSNIKMYIYDTDVEMRESREWIMGKYPKKADGSEGV